MATYKRNKSGGTQAEVPSNSASPVSSVGLSAQGINNNAPKYGTLVPNRIFVGGISSNTTETELCQLFAKYGNVKATKIIADRAGVSKGYGFVTFDSEEEVRCLIQDSNNIVLKERKLNIAPAVKKQPSFSRSFDASSPPPPTPNLYFHNGVPYTFHNGMAFFPPNVHQPALAALPPTSDSPMYQSYAPAQNTTPAPYGTPVLVPAPPPIFIPQNYPYQPLPMTNGGQFIYTGSGSVNGNAGSSVAGTPDNNYVSTPITSQFFTQQYSPAEATFYPQSMIVYNYNGDYDAMEQQTVEIVQQSQNHHYERQYGPMGTNTGARWTSHQQIMSKRMPFNKRQNGPTQNAMMPPNTNNVRLAKKPNLDCDLGGGGDAQPIVELALTPPGSPAAHMEATSKMQSLSLGTSS